MLTAGARRPGASFTARSYPTAAPPSRIASSLRLYPRAMRIVVVGAGAIGTWLGAALCRAGQEVVLVARGRHGEAMAADGVTIEGGEAYHVSPRVVGRVADAGPADAVFLTVKAHDQASVAGDVAGLLAGPDAPVVVAQNGIPWWYFHPEERRVETVDPGGAISAALPARHALGMVVYLGAAVREPGVVATRPEAGLILGEPDGSDSERLRRVAAALEAAGFPTRTTDRIREDIWTKLMGNATFNPISTLTGSGLATMATDPAVRAVIAAAMEEVVAVADALGVPISMSIEERLDITARLGDHKPSTLQDLEAGKPLELGAICHAVLELAEGADIPAPHLRAIVALATLHARELGLRVG